MGRITNISRLVRFSSLFFRIEYVSSLFVCLAYISNGKVMGWGNKAIEIRNVDSGSLDGVFMHKRSQKLKYLCEKNEKVFFSSIRNGSSCQIYFMALNKMSSW